MLPPGRAAFRDAMAHLSAAVNIVTTGGPHGRCGITASAVCSVTDSPPTMLACINRSSALHDILAGNGAICINVLPADRQELARHFAGLTGLPMSARFDAQSWHEGRLGVPVLVDALASIEGRIVEMKAVGSHSVVFVEVEQIALRGEGDGLIYFDRGFHRLSRAARPDTAP
ncbi:4-hydroxyphenylacetate 3-monooxygenase reductase component [Paraburkholderia silvatlantica]|uniref:4-hydroxyphenylacetate 3-monooxygenase reductase component n=1 Tax=Paraburkholderia silvatlantica TaxID=321895 RepID=A0A2V4UK76_9BURK|nr:4-hydroxyphenylacetate 3-monooxygenase, reductase component [Paraburkholderia silvatlantica]PYE21186.1 4-hydroxyphenylacetate 3-monooxygenase reductase component [Paraburkholderia silvatlantica]